MTAREIAIRAVQAKRERARMQREGVRRNRVGECLCPRCEAERRAERETFGPGWPE